MSDPTNLPDIHSAISSPASEDGVTPCVSPDGPMIGPSGPVPALANLSARQAKALGLLTSGTYGRPGSISLHNANLGFCLASRLRQRLDTAGSTLFKMTWKQVVTPSVRLVCLLRASGHRTSGQGCGSWVSPTAQDHSRGGKPARPWDTGIPLTQQAALASWPTPCQQDGPNGGPSQGTDRLPGAAGLATWATPSSRDYKSNSATPEFHAARLQQTRGKPLSEQAHQLSGPTVSGSHAATEKPGQLNPRLSGWLMGYPIAWDLCALQAIPTVRTRNVSSTPRSSKKAKRGSGG